MTFISLEMRQTVKLSRGSLCNFALALKRITQQKVAKVAKKSKNGWLIRVSEFSRTTTISSQMTLINQCVEILTFDFSRSGHLESSFTNSQ